MKIKNTITGSLAAFAVFASQASAEIVLTEDLSAYGYIDVAYTDGNDGADLEGGAAEFELGFSFAPAGSAWSAVAEISYDNDETDSEFETVTITYVASESLSFTVGNILSYQGFETYDATGLYQYSYSGYGDENSGVLYSAGYANGASADYASGDIALGAWIGESGGAGSYEFLAAYTGIEGLTAKFIYADDPSYETINAWASYEYGDFTFAVEVVDTDYTDGETLESAMGLIYYSLGDGGITLRYSEVEYSGVDYTKFTVSPGYSFSDNVFGLVEVSAEDYDDDAFVSLAAELIYSF
jgi:hypothetical protein